MSQVTSLQLLVSAPHMGEVAHSEVRSMSNVSDSNCPPAEGSAPSPLFPNCINESKVRGDIGRSMVLLQVVGVTQMNLVFRYGAAPAERKPGL